MFARPTRAVVTLLIAGQIVTLSAFLATPASASAEDTLTVEQIFGGHSLVTPLPRGMRWQGNSKGVSYIARVSYDGESRKALVLQEVPSGKDRVLCIPDTVTIPTDLRDPEDRKFSIKSYRWNQKGTRIVFTFAGDIFLLSSKDGRIERVTQTSGKETDPEFSPDGSMLAYTRDHDLYIYDLEDREERRLTETSDEVLSGVLAWVYMEELFTRGDVKAYWWSPDSKRLAFLEFTESPVPEFPLVDWIPVHATHELQRYPKSGDPNPGVRVGMVSSDGGEVVWADTDTSDDSYIARLYWLGDSRGIAIEKLNRAQDLLTVYFANARNGRLEEVLEESDDTWVNVTYLRHYYKKKRQFIWGSERGGHSHLYLYNMDGSLERQLTDGEWQVTGLAGVNEKKGRIYFIANKDDLRERQLYEVTEKGKLKRLSEEAGDHNVTISPNTKYYIDRFSTHARPPRIAVYDIKGKKLFDIADSMSDGLRTMERAEPEFLTVDANDLSYNCMITKPLDFDPTRKYPVIVYVYGGPHAQVVRKRWSRHNLWHSMMAAKGYVVFSLDNRGSFGRGKAWEDPVLKNLGQYELEDQVAGVEYLKSLSYVDGDRIGIWGWSYGGYMTLMGLFKANDVFKAGVAVAPVSDWHLYDTIYTERYMKRPKDNPDGYEAGSPINFTDELRGKLLVIHGDADDNVHAQNTFKLVRKLIDSGKDFDLMVYPQKLHGISGTADRKHLYNKMTRFFDRHLMGIDDTEPMHP